MSQFRRKLMVSQEKEDSTSKIILYFNDNVGEWFLEYNQTGHNTFYQVGSGELIHLDYYPEWGDHYLSFANGSLRNTTITAYNNPSEFCGMGIKRRTSGLFKVDLSNFIGPSRWYFWDYKTWSDLQEIVFPNKFSNQYIDFVGYMNNITIPFNTNCIIGGFAYTYNITYLQGQYNNLRIWGGGGSANEFNNVLNNLPDNISNGIFGVNSTGYSNLSESQKAQFTAKNMEIRVSVGGNNYYNCDWIF